jgi:hypothetical protein
MPRPAAAVRPRSNCDPDGRRKAPPREPQALHCPAAGEEGEKAKGGRHVWSQLEGGRVMRRFKQDLATARRPPRHDPSAAGPARHPVGRRTAKQLCSGVTRPASWQARQARPAGRARLSGSGRLPVVPLRAEGWSERRRGRSFGSGAVGWSPSLHGLASGIDTGRDEGHARGRPYGGAPAGI